MLMKTKISSLNNFITINSLCDFQVTTAYDVRTSVYKNLTYYQYYILVLL